MPIVIENEPFYVINEKLHKGKGKSNNVVQNESHMDCYSSNRCTLPVLLQTLTWNNENRRSENGCTIAAYLENDNGRFYNNFVSPG